MPRHQKRTDGETLPQKLAKPCLVLLMMIAVELLKPRTASPTETVHELSWSRIALPESVAASSLTTAADELLVGGHASAGEDHPVLTWTVQAPHARCRCIRTAPTQRSLTWFRGCAWR